MLKRQRVAEFSFAFLRRCRRGVSRRAAWWSGASSKSKIAPSDKTAQLEPLETRILLSQSPGLLFGPAPFDSDSPVIVEPLVESELIAQGPPSGHTGSLSLDRLVYPVPFGVPADFAPDSVNTISAGRSLFPIHQSGMNRTPGLDSGEFIANGDLVIHLRINDPDFDTSSATRDQIAVNTKDNPVGPVKLSIVRDSQTIVLGYAGGPKAIQGVIDTGDDAVKDVETGTLFFNDVNRNGVQDPGDLPIRQFGPIQEIAPDAGIFEIDIPIRYTDGPASALCPVTTHFTNTLDSKGDTVTDRFDVAATVGGYCLLQGDVLLIEYTDPSDESGQATTVVDAATFELRTGALQSDKLVYIIGRDILLTLDDPDLDLDSDRAETYDLDLIEWDSDAATVTIGDADGEEAAFGGPTTFRETGDSTGIFQAIIEMPEALDGDRLERAEDIVLEYTDWGSSESAYVGEVPENVNVTIFTSNFGATVELDQKVYTWTDKVFITIVAPDHNFDPDGIDTIGNTDLDPIKISTRGADLDNYELVETGTDTGIFTGEVVLTGFAHDADGNPLTGVDNGNDTNPRTEGSGPTDGFLQSDDDDGLTVSFEYTEDEVVVGSALIQWNVGEVQWHQSSYSESDTGRLRVIDPDMNLNPESVDSFKVDVWSDTDAAGINVILTETSEASGIFESAVFFTATGGSFENRLRVSDGDTITAEYEDHTSPTQNGLFDVTATATMKVDQIPSFAPTVSLDQKVYSWTDKVIVTVKAPGHNFDIDLINEIFVNVSTRDFDLSHYRLLETGRNTGVFMGEVILTGFSHDADGDSTTGDSSTGFDTNPVTQGKGPVDGFLQSDDDDGVTVSFQFSPNETVVGTSLIKWNVGEIQWLQASFSAFGSGRVRLIDPDMNLDPGDIDNFEIDVWSDTDAAGIHVTLTETDEASGVFEGTVFFTTTDGSFGHQLRISYGDTITAEYDDHTLPSPYSPFDAIDLTATADIFSPAIELDQKVYSWTDKVHITVSAPGRNIDQNLINEILVRVSTRGFELDNYRLVETAADTGIFAGEVILTGFGHDADGDSRTGDPSTGFDTNPMTGGKGPADGFLQADDEDGLTVSFRVSPNETIIDSALIQWNIGEVEWLEPSYPAPGTGVVRLFDPDMNLDPEAIDRFVIDVWSDSDVGGIDLTMVETGEATGIFRRTVFFSTVDESSGHRLRVSPGDVIFAEYVDHTLPAPFTPSDELTVVAKSRIELPDFKPTVKLDRSIYSWTDKVNITVVAVDHQFDANFVDTIRVNVFTRGSDLNDYVLVETGSDTGIFAGEVNLTGFLHDADGDFNTGQSGTGFDTQPMTAGSGPADGFLPAGRKDGIVVGVQSPSGQTSFASARIQWNIGDIQWLKQTDPTATTRVVRLIDPEMNLDPEAVDSLTIRVASDTDIEGIVLTLTETNESTGVFEGTVVFSTVQASFGNRLLVSVGDKVYARYRDHTLPDPFTLADDIAITATTVVDAVPQLERVLMSNLRILDNSTGNQVSTVSMGQFVSIGTNLEHRQNQEQPYAFLVEIQDSQGITVFRSSPVTGVFGPHEFASIGVRWEVNVAGSFDVTVSVWEGVEDSTALSMPLTRSFMAKASAPDPAPQTSNLEIKEASEEPISIASDETQQPIISDVTQRRVVLASSFALSRARLGRSGVARLRMRSLVPDDTASSDTVINDVPEVLSS